MLLPLQGGSQLAARWQMDPLRATEGKGRSCSAAAWELHSYSPKLNAQGWENSQFLLVGDGLGGLGCFYGNYVSPDILVVL